MTRTLRLIPLLFLPAFASSCQLLTETQPRQATYAYVGKVTAGKPVQESPDKVTVPMRFTGGEWQRNSAICFQHAKTDIHGQEIHLKVFTGLCSQYNTPVAYTFRLKGITRSEYDLVFIDPDGTRHPLGKLQL